MRAILVGVWLIFSYLSEGKEPDKEREKKEQKWEKLFFSPLERISPILRPQIQNSIDYQGILHSSGKKPTYWINSTMQNVLPKGITRRGHILIVREANQHIKLAPGEIYQINDASFVQNAEPEKE